MGRDEQVSRALSKVLRHKAKELGIEMSADGYVKIDDLLKHNLFKSIQVTEQEILASVETNAKKRFELSADSKSIRAVQGHSLEVEVSSLEPLTLETLPENIIHGTNATAWASIAKEGLKRMNRLHIHLASGLPGEVISGMRQSASILIYVDGPKMVNDGIDVLRATNGAILTAGVDGVLAPKYFLKVIDRKSNKDLLNL